MSVWCLAADEPCCIFLWSSPNQLCWFLPKILQCFNFYTLQQWVSGQPHFEREEINYSIIILYELQSTLNNESSAASNFWKKNYLFCSAWSQIMNGQLSTTCSNSTFTTCQHNFLFVCLFFCCCCFLHVILKHGVIDNLTYILLHLFQDFNILSATFPSSTQVAYILSLGVVDEHRRKGIGK